MIAVSAEYLAAARDTLRTERLRGTLVLSDGTEMELTEADWLSDSVVWDNQCVTGEELAFGCVYLGQITLKLRTDMSRYKLYNAVLTPTYGLKLADGSWYSLPLGVFTVAEAEWSGGFLKLTAYDNILWLNEKYTGVVLYGTAYEILSQICTEAGLEMGQSEEEILALCPNAEEKLQLDSNSGCTTWRDCVGAVAQLLGGFGMVNRAGQLVIRQFSADPCVTLAANQRNSVTVSDFTTHYCGLTVSEDGETTSCYAEGETGLEMTVEDAPLWRDGILAAKQNRTDNLFLLLHGLDYTPAELTMPGDPALECGDRIRLAGVQGCENAPEMLVTHFVWKLRGEETLRSVGKNPYLESVSSWEANAVRNLQNEKTEPVYYLFTNPKQVQALSEGQAYRLTTVLVTVNEADNAILHGLLTGEATPSTETVTVSGTDSSGKTVTIQEVRDKAMTVTVEYTIDGVLQDFKHRQRVLRGAFSLPLFLPLEYLGEGYGKQFGIRLRVSGGSAVIEQNGLWGVISGRGLSAVQDWGGLIDAEDFVGSTSLQRLTLDELSDSAAVQQVIPEPVAAVENLQSLAMRKLTVAGLIDNATVQQG